MSDLALVRPHGNNVDTRKINGSAASKRFNYEYTDAELEQIARRRAAVAEIALDVQVVVNVNFEDQGIRAGQKLAQMLEGTRTH